MKKQMAAVLALSFLGLTACGSMPEHDDTLTEQAQQIMTATKAETETETETESETFVTIRDTFPKVTTLTSVTGMQTAASSSTAVSTNTAVPATGTAASTHKNTEHINAGSSGNSGGASGGNSNSGNSGGNSAGAKSTAKVIISTTKIAGTTVKEGASTTKASTSTTKESTKATTATTAKETAPETTEPVTDAITDAPSETPEVPNDGVTRMVNNVMVVNSGTDHPRALELFYGNNDTGARFAQTLNSYKAALGENVNVWSMVVPTSQAFYTPADIAGEYGDQLAQFNHICENFDGVTGIPVYEVLDAHKDEPTYSRTDYHWQPLAAYYAAEQFAAYAGVPYAPLDTYEAVTREGYLGAFYRVNNVSELGNYPEEFTYYKPANLDAIQCTYYNTSFGGAHEGSLFFENNSVSASYTVFVGTDECILETDTNVENGRVLVIFKDSYGNALVPFLTQSFSKIYLCDFRYFDNNAISFIQEVGATDLLFAMSTVAVCTSAKVDKVANNMYK